MSEDERFDLRRPLTRDDGTTVSARDVEAIRQEARRAAEAMLVDAVLRPRPLIPDQRGDDDPV